MLTLSRLSTSLWLLAAVPETVRQSDCLSSTLWVAGVKYVFFMSFVFLRLYFVCTSLHHQLDGLSVLGAHDVQASLQALLPDAALAVDLGLS